MLEGTVHPDFAPVANALRRLLPRRMTGGAAVCVYHRGEKVADLWGGTRDSAGTPWKADTLSTSFSTTKGVASTLLHVLVDRGLVDYNAPVADYWPEFAQEGKERITIRDVMCHEAGLYRISEMIDDAERVTDWAYMTEALAAARPAHAPGAAHGYHAFTYGWLVGEVAQRVTGKPFSELLAAEIAAPLGLEGLYCGVPEDQLHRRAELIFPGGGGGASVAKLEGRVRGLNAWLGRMGMDIDLEETLGALMPPGMASVDFNDEGFAQASIPAANGMFTARSLARMYALLAGDGELDGVRLMSRGTLDRATQVQSRTRGRVIPIAMHWRLGYHRVFTIRGKARNGFGHFGFGGSGAWACPDRNLSVALTVNSGVGTPFGDARIARIGGVALRCADRR